MLGNSVARARAEGESAARRDPAPQDARRRASALQRVSAIRRALARRRRAARSGVTLRGVIARRARGRRSARITQAFGAVGLIALSLLAILPAHANGLATATAARPALDVQPIAEESDVDSVAAPAAPSTHRAETWGLGATSGPFVAEHAGRAGSVPPTLGWYRLAATEHTVSAELLRALHEVETNAAPDGCVQNAQGSGAVGPFQFKPATFRQYGVDANYDGRRDICSFADAAVSAARYLRALGAGGLDDPATRQALTRYGTDPDRVLSLARHYRDRADRSL